MMKKINYYLFGEEQVGLEAYIYFYGVIVFAALVIITLAFL